MINVLIFRQRKRTDNLHNCVELRIVKPVPQPNFVLNFLRDDIVNIKNSTLMRMIYNLLAALLLGLPFARAQSVGPTTLNSAGGSVTVAAQTFEWSIGEMTLVNTATASNIVVTQGVLQPIQPATGISMRNTVADNMKVYPVPAQDVVYLQPAFNAGGMLRYSLMDASGKSIKDVRVQLHSGKELQQVDLSALPAGNYMLNLHFADTNAPYANTYKIQKIQ